MGEFRGKSLVMSSEPELPSREDQAGNLVQANSLPMLHLRFSSDLKPELDPLTFSGGLEYRSQRVNGASTVLLYPIGIR